MHKLPFVVIRAVAGAPSFLGRGVYRGDLTRNDEDPRGFEHETIMVKSADALRVNLAGRGGFAARIIRK